MGFSDICSLISEFFLRVYSFFVSIFSGAPHESVVSFDSGLSVTLCDTIGEGAYSFVYTASSGGKTYALKKMYLQSVEFERCALMEVASFKKFHHPNILKLLDSVSRTENKSRVMYMLFPFMEQGSLRNILLRRERGQLPRPSLREILTDFTAICEAVGVLHAYNPAYVHQDIKPENILIAEDGTPLLTDFGSVRLADVNIISRSQALSIADEASQHCTISYRAPELFDPRTGTILDSRTDVWALGCLLFAWWHGYSPFECEITEVGVKVVECTHLRVLAKVPSCGPSASAEDRTLQQLVEEILEQDITKRPFLPAVIASIRKTRETLGGRRQMVSNFGGVDTV
mmetsp:Transcript_7680/g.11394  ORF Transcript_7680/g.11394 Transcript_7680/m.11394 type:complete len:344 (+) Transcript_7680:58-1089(+)